MDQSRFEFLKTVAAYFKENPREGYYQGATRTECFSLLALQFSTPNDILDPTAPEFLNQTEERIKLFEQNFAQGKPPPQTTPLDPELEKAVQTWQYEAGSGKILPGERWGGARIGGDMAGENHLKTWQKLDPKMGPKVDQFLKGSTNPLEKDRFEFCKGLTKHFQENPQANEYLGVSRQTCYSFLALQFCDPDKILDPTTPQFLKQVDEKISSLDEKVKQNQPLPLTGVLPSTMDKTIQMWQDAIKGKSADEATEIGKKFERALKENSSRAWKKISPKMAPKMEWFLKSGLQKAVGVVGFGLMATFFSLEVIKQAVKTLAPLLYLMYNFFAAIGGAVFAGAIYGGVAGALAGGVGGAVLGAKLGAAIGFAVGGPVGAVIGGVLGGITGFIVGILAGTAIGMAIGAAVGYAWEHWIWRPLQGAWTWMGDALGGIGNAFGGAMGGMGGFFGGILGGAGSAIGGLLSWAGGGITTAGGFVAGLGAGLSTVSLPASMVTVPVLGATGGVFALTLWMNTSIVGTAFMRQPAPQAVEVPLPESYQYISLSKNGAFSGIGQPINYTLTITAKEKRLANIQVADSTSFTCASNPPSVPRKTLDPIATLDPDQTVRLTYKTGTNDQFNNCTVTNTATVTFDVSEEGKTNQSVSASYTITIGSPPASGCPVPNGTILCYSYYWPSSSVCRHCQPGYSLTCNPTNTTGIYDAIDVVGGDVYLPAILGETPRWQFLRETQIIDYGRGGIDWGWRKEFLTAAPVKGDRYELFLLHLNQGDPSLTEGQIYPSGRRVGTFYRNSSALSTPHVHVTVRKNGSEWLPADVDLKMCGS